jgi:hypothetical protein
MPFHAPGAGGAASVLVESGSESKINSLTAITLPAAVDELVVIDDPGGTPVTRKITHDDVLFGANGTPSTQAHGDSAAIGTALDAARSDHKHAMPSVPTASTTTVGAAELATITEVNTGTDTGRTITPDALAGSNLGEKAAVIVVFLSDESVTTGNGKASFAIPSTLAGMNLVDTGVVVHTKGVTGTTTIQLRRRRSTTDADMLSTLITLGDEESVADGTIDTSKDDVATGDNIYVDIDAIHSGTAAKGLSVWLVFRLP